MSRSKRKHPYVTDNQGGCSKLPKRKATRAVRHTTLEDSPENGSSYKKYSSSWDIRDYSFYSPDSKKGYRK